LAERTMMNLKPAKHFKPESFKVSCAFDLPTEVQLQLLCHCCSHQQLQHGC
jgi:hypothetical protein